MERLCQSCAMPLSKKDMGTNADGTANGTYCKYCFKNGKFTSNITMKEQIEINLKFLDVYNENSGKKFTAEEARAEMMKFFPTLERWKT